MSSNRQSSIVNPPFPPPLSACATLACLWECTAAKPGNVHRGADFEDATYLDFVLSAQAIGPVFAEANKLSVGQLVLQAVQATRVFVRHNTNLGMILLFAPLAKVPRDRSWADGVNQVVQSLTSADAADVYEAIRLANPGGLGKVAEGDVHAAPPSDLLHAMRLAAERDRIAAQYVTNFADVFERVVPAIADGIDRGWSLQSTLIYTHVQLLAQLPDTLIARKCGAAIAEQASVMAQWVLASGRPGDEAYEHALGNFDFWLRADGHRRNPGTTADLIAAGLFCLLRDGRLSPLTPFYDP